MALPTPKSDLDCTTIGLGALPHQGPNLYPGFFSCRGCLYPGFISFQARWLQRPLVVLWQREHLLVGTGVRRARGYLSCAIELPTNPKYTTEAWRSEVFPFTTSSIPSQCGCMLHTWACFAKPRDDFQELRKSLLNKQRFKNLSNPPGYSSASLMAAHAAFNCKSCRFLDLRLARDHRSDVRLVSKDLQRAVDFCIPQI